MKGYKAFEKGLICKGKQYAENTVFEEDSAEICKSGMRFCKNPLDCLDYYPLIDDNGDLTEFAEVEAIDEPVTDDNKKYSSKKLKIGAKLDLPHFIKTSIDFLIEETAGDNNSGNWARMASSGNTAQMASAGDFAHMASSGNRARMASSGNTAQMASAGDWTQIASSGNRARMASAGDWTQIASSGNWAHMASSGNWARMASSGNTAQMASAGDLAHMASAGDSAQIASSGRFAVICCTGKDSIVKAKKGSWITLSEWKYDDKLKAIIPICVKTEYVDGEKIKEDVFYILKNGEFEEIKNNTK